MAEGKKEIDWGKIETEYVTTNKTYDALAREYGIRKNTIAEHGRKGCWTAKRAQARDETVTKAVQKSVRKKATQLASVEKAAVKCGAMARRMINNAEKQAKAAEKAARNGEEAEIKFTSGELINMVTALKGVTELIRDLFDLPSESEKIDRKLRAEKLMLEKEKLAEVKKTGGTVVIELAGTDEAAREAWTK